MNPATKKKIVFYIIAAAMIIITIKTGAAITYNHDYTPRGVGNDFYFALYNNGGTTRSWYQVVSNHDLFDDSPTLNDSLYVYGSNQFDGVKFVNIVPLSSSSHNLTWEYWDGSTWQTLNVTDGTNHLTQDGTVTWTPPTDWIGDLDYVTNAAGHGNRGRFMIRARLSAFSGFTEGGALPLNNYQEFREKYIQTEGGESLTMSDIYDADVANGWGVVTKTGTNEYHLDAGLYMPAGTLTLDDVSVQIGSPGVNKWYQFRIVGGLVYANVPTSGQLLDTTSTEIKYYGRGMSSTVFLYPEVGSAFYNTMFRLPNDNEQYRRFSIGNTGSDGENYVYYFNVFFDGIMYPSGSQYFKRVNFQNIQYMLTDGVTEYDNCYFRAAFSADPDYAPILKRPLIDGGSSTDNWRSGYQPDDIARQHHMEVISGTWPAGNKYVFFLDQSSSDPRETYIQLYSNYLNVYVQYENGTSIEDATITITDQHGNNALWQDTDLEWTGVPDSPTQDHSFSMLKDSLSEGDVLWHWGEILRIDSIEVGSVYEVYDVTRGLENSARAYSFRDYYSPVYKRATNMTINGSQTEIYLPERNYHRLSLDGGVTTTGNLERIYNPYNITITKEGYDDWNAIINITSETDITIVMTPEETTAEINSTPYNGDWAYEEKEEQAKNTINEQEAEIQALRKTIKKIIIGSGILLAALITIITAITMT